jgi:uncharacterized membrane protein SpoIIM required for sporulation
VKLSTALLLIPAILIAGVIAVANRADIRLSLDPFSDTHPALVIEMPLYLLLFGAILLGVILGGIAVTLTRVTRGRAQRPSVSVERAIVPLDAARTGNDITEI